jgi:hypothetical protein
MVASIFASQQPGMQPVSYSAEAVALFARMSSQPDSVRKGLINDLIVALKTAGVWTKLEVLYLFAAHDAQAARLNWISSSFDATTANSPVFTTDRGYAGDGSTSYLSTGWNPSLSSIFLLNASSVGVYINAGADTADNNRFTCGVRDTGTNDGVNICPRGATTIRGRINNNAQAVFGAVSTNRGSTAIVRSSSVTLTAYRDGSAAGVADPFTSTARPNLTAYVCGVNGSGALQSSLPDRIASVYFGGVLTAIEVAALHSARLTYLTAIGAN